ncbi:MAG: T9SS type A sorting domain-containing protein [Ignavibacteria bacterium]|nr:T9SS type A sorting domain-containing protein [Ignavibacteria bacterium]
MKRFLSILLIAIGLLVSSNLSSQSIRLVRSDVDSTRAHFITATFRFGVDITLESAPGCTGAAFELRYTNASVVRFSGWSAGTFGSRGTIQVDQSDITTGFGKISVGALSGDPAYAKGIDNPIIIHLDFVVTPDALHNQSSVFTFVNAQGIINKDSGTIVQLTSNPLTFAIRSFVQVWPGDADNNGLVDTRDASQIGRFIGNNDSLTMFRGFKRRPSSIYWSSQTALAWDSAQATYTDCDGSGDVTITDLLVVPLNFGKTTFAQKGETPLVVPVKDNPPYSPENLVKIPILCTSDRQYLAASGKVAWNMWKEYKNAQVVGIEAGELFCGDVMLYYNIDSIKQNADFAIGSLSHTCLAPAGVGVIAYLLLDPQGPGTFPLPMLQTPTGITVSGLFFPLLAPSGVYEESATNDISFEIRNRQFITTSSIPSTINITDVLGRTLLTAESTNTIDLQMLPTGVYFAAMTSGNTTLVKKFILSE